MGSIRKQAIANTLISYIGVVIGFVNVLVLQPRMLRPDELGLTRILFSASVLIATLFPLGLQAFSIKYFPKFKDPGTGHNGFFGLINLVALTGYIIVAILVYAFKDLIISHYGNSPLFVEFFNYIFPMSLFLGLISIYNIYASVQFKTTVPSFLNDIFQRLFIMAVVSLYYLKLLSFNAFVMLFVLAIGSQLFLLIIYIFRIGSVSFSINWSLIRELQPRRMASYVFLLSIASLASMAIKNNIDTIFIGSYLDLDHVAVYTIAYTIASMIEVPANALSKIADPKISDAIARSDFKMIKDVYFKSTRLLMIIGGLLFAGLFINAQTLLWLLPAKYHAGSTVVMIISVSAFFNMATGMNSSIIYYSEKYVQGSLVLIALIILSVILNVLLIPVWGIEGAAVATGCSLVLFNFFKTLIIYRAYGLQPFGRYVAVVLLLVAVCIGISYFLPRIHGAVLDIIYRSAIITAVYALGIHFSRIAPEGKEFVRSLMERK